MGERAHSDFQIHETIIFTNIKIFYMSTIMTLGSYCCIPKEELKHLLNTYNRIRTFPWNKKEQLYIIPPEYKLCSI